MDLGEWLRNDWEEVGDLLKRMRLSEAEALGEMILAAQRVFVVGQGRSGLVMKMFAMRLMQLGLAAFVVGDATTPAIMAGDLLVVGSGSGETPGAVSAARRAREVGARVAALTSRSASTLGGLADAAASAIHCTPGQPLAGTDGPGCAPHQQPTQYEYYHSGPRRLAHDLSFFRIPDDLPAQDPHEVPIRLMAVIALKCGSSLRQSGAEKGLHGGLDQRQERAWENTSNEHARRRHPQRDG